MCKSLISNCSGVSSQDCSCASTNCSPNLEPRSSDIHLQKLTFNLIYITDFFLTSSADDAEKILFVELDLFYRKYL